mmetsp:Transcript_85360/g.198473  ORF Transcript_85360/g.198473 Transcript_85360/m.198473 type:complete len:240 (-) Transcript_85360:243-962(-)
MAGLGEHIVHALLCRRGCNLQANKLLLADNLYTACSASLALLPGIVLVLFLAKLRDLPLEEPAQRLFAGASPGTVTKPGWWLRLGPDHHAFGDIPVQGWEPQPCRDGALELNGKVEALTERALTQRRGKQKPAGLADPLRNGEIQVPLLPPSHVDRHIEGQKVQSWRIPHSDLHWIKISLAWHSRVRVGAAEQLAVHAHSCDRRILPKAPEQRLCQGLQAPEQPGRAAAVEVFCILGCA